MSFIDPKKSLLAKISDPKKSLRPAPPPPTPPSLKYVSGASGVLPLHNYYVLNFGMLFELTSVCSQKYTMSMQHHPHPPTASSIIPFPLPSKIPFTLNVVHLNIWLLLQYLKEFITFSITPNYQIVGFYLYKSAISNLFKLFEFSLNIISTESCVLHLAVCQ